VQASVSSKESAVTLKLSGAANYYTINLNGKVQTTTQSEITLPLLSNKNSLTVSTDKDCQGVYEDIISLGNDILVYPNPISEGILNIVLPKLEVSGTLELYTISGGMILQQSFTDNSEVLQIDVDAVPVGTYILKVTQGNQAKNTLIIIN